MNGHNLFDQIKLIQYNVLLVLCIFIVSCVDNSKDKKPVADKVIEAAQFDSLHSDNSKYLKEQDLLKFVLSAENISISKHLGIPFDTLNFDKIIAYDFDGSEDRYPSVLDRSLKFVPVILKQQSLTQKQAEKILSVLAKKSTYGGATSSCFDPHLALLFFKDNKLKNTINICLDCNYLLSDAEIPAKTHFIIKNGKQNDYSKTGFTKTGKKEIIDLCKDLNFYYGQIESK